MWACQERNTAWYTFCERLETSSARENCVAYAVVPLQVTGKVSLEARDADGSCKILPLNKEHRLTKVDTTVIVHGRNRKLAFQVNFEVG
jgi:hypothetical protein